jgi:hypothetical protein
MHYQGLIGAVAFAAMLGMAGSALGDDRRLPDWTGQYFRLGGGQFDPSKPGGRGQAPPLTAEYMAIWEAALKDEREGGQEYNPQVKCLPAGMPRMMIGYEPIEMFVTPETTYLRFLYMNEFRRIYTDGRAFPAKINPSFTGYSIGKWIDEDGRPAVLEVETRGFRGPRVADVSGIPLHNDNATVIKEKFYGDKATPGVVHDEITIIDNALSRPWSIKRSYKKDARRFFMEYVCAEGNEHVFIGKENYVLSADGFLMPTKRDQPPPDLRYFEAVR